MKFPKNSDIEEYKKTLQAGALKGAAFGATIGLGAGAILRRRTSYFVNAGGFQKMLVYAAPAAFCTVVNMELTSRDFEEYQRLKQHGTVPVEKPHANADTWDRATQWASDNKYKLVVAGWAGSLLGSFYLVNRDPYMTKAQKIVQARVYAQGATVALLLATVFLSVTPTGVTDKERAKAASRSWERDIQYVETANHPHGVYGNDQKGYEQAERILPGSTDPSTGSKSSKQENEAAQPSATQ